MRLPNVQHIATRIDGDLSGDISSLEVAGALHPTAAVCGTPTEDALAAIRDLEGMDRGRYAGPVGWTNVTGDGEWAIALRCAEIDGARGRLLAGGGLVAASEPEAELEETRLKFRAMLSVLEGA
jgi:menaquinone-specific isochorismate synthase